MLRYLSTSGPFSHGLVFASSWFLSVPLKRWCTLVASQNPSGQHAVVLKVPLVAPAFSGPRFSLTTLSPVPPCLASVLSVWFLLGLVLWSMQSSMAFTPSKRSCGGPLLSGTPSWQLQGWWCSLLWQSHGMNPGLYWLVGRFAGWLVSWSALLLPTASLVLFAWSTDG